MAQITLVFRHGLIIVVIEFLPWLNFCHTSIFGTTCNILFGISKYTTKEITNNFGHGLIFVGLILAMV